jgi:hypothetical protein
MFDMAVTPCLWVSGSSAAVEENNSGNRAADIVDVYGNPEVARGVRPSDGPLRAPTRMMPYRIPAPPPPEVVDVDVMRFAAFTRLLRRLELAAAFEALLLACVACLAPLTVLPARAGNVALMSTPTHAIAHFDWTPRKLPPAYAMVTMWCPSPLE